MYNQAAYNLFVADCKAVAADPRFNFVSITNASKASGVPKGQLRVVALAFGLIINTGTKSGGNGRYGLIAKNDKG
jgi:hypothetical protein